MSLLGNGRRAPSPQFRRLSKCGVFLQESELGMCSLLPVRKVDRIVSPVGPGRSRMGDDEGMDFISRDLGDSETERIQTVSVDQFCQDHSINHIDLMRLRI
jgi:hypothetical protein